MLKEKREPRFCLFWGFGFDLKRYLSLFTAIIFLLFGTKQSKTGGELLYYNLYHEEELFTWKCILNCLIDLL